MNPLFKLASHALFGVGLVVFWLFAGSKYRWMEQMDPSVSAAAIEGGTDGRTMATLLLLVAIVASQSAVALRSRVRTEKIVSILLATIAAAAWIVSRLV